MPTTPIKRLRLTWAEKMGIIDKVVCSPSMSYLDLACWVMTEFSLPVVPDKTTIYDTMPSKATLRKQPVERVTHKNQQSYHHIDLGFKGLNQKFYRGFGIWGRRARTVRRRLLLVHTLILSTLWYYTEHISIPKEYTKRWQRMITKFVLAKKTDEDSTQLYQSKQSGGLQIPHIETQLNVQRILMLQQFTTLLLSNSAEIWPSLAAVSFRNSMPFFQI
ncbi:Pollike protein putative [Phytophthora palmivora]|uniref:Pollike protein putative n=1 Tax=Phytophthora palmivora TaxID=4796 RepID=A0A2P4YVK2_9STRA|nr:Pollike protein putative [Phytophthora palmivora]